MKELRCNKCNRTQKSGKFCLDCGQPLDEVVTHNVEFKPISTSRSAEGLKRDVRKWLNRIGVQNPDIQIQRDGHSATLTYTIYDVEYTFTSHHQRGFTENLAAVEQFVHYRVLGIERGIESIENAFAGYAALPDYSTFLKQLDTKQLKDELKRLHPDTDGTGDVEQYQQVLAELKGRKE